MTILTQSSTLAAEAPVLCLKSYIVGMEEFKYIRNSEGLLNNLKWELRGYLCHTCWHMRFRAVLDHHWDRIKAPKCLTCPLEWQKNRYGTIIRKVFDGKEAERMAIDIVLKMESCQISMQWLRENGFQITVPRGPIRY